MELFIYIFAALFSVINPIGTVPIFVGLTQDDDKKERSRISLWTAIDVFLILIISFFIGQYVLDFFGISIDGQVGKYISVQASHRTVREPLDSHGS
jgi:multiple antibiotic resistance protein